MTVGRLVANIKYGEFKLRQYIAERAGLLFNDHSAAILEGAQAVWLEYERDPQSVVGGALSDILEDLSLDLEALRAEANRLAAC